MIWFDSLQITGGSSGIGRAVAIQAAQCGASVTLLARNKVAQNLHFDLRSLKRPSFPTLSQFRDPLFRSSEIPHSSLIFYSISGWNNKPHRCPIYKLHWWILVHQLWKMVPIPKRKSCCFFLCVKLYNLSQTEMQDSYTHLQPEKTKTVLATHISHTADLWQCTPTPHPPLFYRGTGRGSVWPVVFVRK